MNGHRCAGLAGWLLAAGCALSQRVDPAFRPVIADPAHGPGSGPVVWVDQGHHNIVSAERGTRYAPLVAALRAEGYVVQSFSSPFTVSALERVATLVIGNALNVRNVNDWSLPTPSAFTAEETRVLHEWIIDGGSLLFLFDHMPAAGAAADLGAALGLEILNGLVEDPARWDPATFSRTDDTLMDHPITGGSAGYCRVQAVATFDGAAFKAEHAVPLLVLGPAYVSYQTAVAWSIDSRTPRVPVGGWLQGAVLEPGRGRVAVFSDATMFSAQIAPDGSRLGMNTHVGAENLQLLRNTMRWLVHRAPVAGAPCKQAPTE
jgi:hypothetical protein